MFLLYDFAFFIWKRRYSYDSVDFNLAGLVCYSNDITVHVVVAYDAIDVKCGLLWYTVIKRKLVGVDGKEDAL